MSCSSYDGLESAADEFELPDQFELLSTERIGSLDTLSHTMLFATDLSGGEACNIAGEALAMWGGTEAVPEQRVGPANVCVFNIWEAERFPDVRTATVLVSRRSLAPDLDPDTSPIGVVQVTFFADP